MKSPKSPKGSKKHQNDLSREGPDGDSIMNSGKKVMKIKTKSPKSPKMKVMKSPNRDSEAENMSPKSGKKRRSSGVSNKSMSTLSPKKKKMKEENIYENEVEMRSPERKHKKKEKGRSHYC